MWRWCPSSRRTLLFRASPKNPMIVSLFPPMRLTVRYTDPGASAPSPYSAWTISFSDRRARYLRRVRNGCDGLGGSGVAPGPLRSVQRHIRSGFPENGFRLNFVFGRHRRVFVRIRHPACFLCGTLSPFSRRTKQVPDRGIKGFDSHDRDGPSDCFLFGGKEPSKVA